MIRFPKHLERQYAARLVRRLHAACTLVLELVPPARRDAGEDSWSDVATFRAGLPRVRRAIRDGMPVSAESLLPTARAVDDHATRAVDRAVGVDIAGATRRAPTRDKQRLDHLLWARENVDLITSMESRTFDELAELVEQAVHEGRTDLAATIRDRFGVAESRARLIARDQIAKLNGRVTQDRQTALGIQAYEWSSSGDERVRPKHRALDGKVRKWSEPHPTEGHPGSAIACRCVAIPVVDDSELETPEPEAEPAQPPPSLPSSFGGPAVPTFRPPAAPPRRTLPTTFEGASLRPPVFAPPPAVRVQAAPPQAATPRPVPPTTFGGEPLRPPVIVPPPARPVLPSSFGGGLPQLESPRRFKPPDPPGPVELPPHPAPPAPPPGRLPVEVEREVRSVEDRVRAEPEENGAIVLRGGRRIDLTAEHTRDNEQDPRDTLTLPPHAMRAAKADGNAVLTHCHPNGSALSPKDLEVAAFYNLAEIRATSPSGGAWVVRRPLGGWPYHEDLYVTIAKARQEGVKRARLEMEGRIRAAGGDPREGQRAKGFDQAAYDRLEDWHIEAGIREGIEQAGLVLEFDP